ncbi:hypothetical protein ACHAXR_007144 [Thalassiosira sp. AJA248-18]
MKIITSILGAAASILVALPCGHAQMRKAVYNQPVKVLEETRDLMHTEEPDTIVFEECVGKTLPVCEALIKEQVAAHIAEFAVSSPEELDFSVLPVRTSGSDGYWNVGLRTDISGQYVEGVLDDSMVFYPFDWCTTAGCVSNLAWNCEEGGEPMTVDACCDIIKADSRVADADVNDNMIDCFPDYPIGHASKPIVAERVLIHVDSQNIVVHPPRNE